MSAAFLYQPLLGAALLALSLLLWLHRVLRPGPRLAHARRAGELDLRCKDWQPLPLSAPPSADAQDRLSVNRRQLLALTSKPGPRVSVDGFPPHAVNLASADFVGLVGDGRVQAKCEETLLEYGTGSCGPRGFYGTTAVHLACEAQLTSFFKSEESILYSFGPATASSTIPAFAKKGDLIVADEAINFSLQSGMSLSRAEIRWFRHNDMSDLLRVLEMTASEDLRNPKLKYKQRRFLVVEAVYGNCGDVAPMKTIMQLRHQFNFRILVDESFSIGVLGDTGRGVCEHFGIERDEIDIMTFDAGNALVSVGGACVGSREVVGHQRLSGAGYCFSASQPPFLATAIVESIRILESEGHDRIRTLRRNIAVMIETLAPLGVEKKLHLTSDPLSPLIAIRIRSQSILPSGPDLTALQSRVFDLQEDLLRRGVYVGTDRYVEQEHRPPPPGLRVTISSAHSEADLRSAGTAICETLRNFVLSL